MSLHRPGRDDRSVGPNRTRQTAMLFSMLLLLLLSKSSNAASERVLQSTNLIDMGQVGACSRCRCRRLFFNQ